MRLGLCLLSLAVFGAASTASAADGFTDHPRQTEVFGGTAAEVCQWPTTVAITGGGGLCSGALVHPWLVTYAAHCGDGNKTIRFGEDDGVGISRQAQCVANPDYLGTSNQAQDWGFCVLDEPMLDIPYVPPLYGCELDMIQDNTPVVVVGFGVGGDGGSGPSGTKRWGDTVIVNSFGATAQIGAQGTGVTTCSGDSGGSAYIQMGDGSYRALSMVSTGLPGCNDTTGTHALMHPAVPWIEETSQIDITPCHDVDGTWNPNPNCTGFFAGGSTPSGNWDNGCMGTPASGPSTTCGDSFEATPDNDPPAVAVATPTQGEEFDSGALVTINIDAIDDGYGVQEVWIEIDGMEQPVRETYPPFAFPEVPFPDGVYTIVAHAVDWAGNEGVSEPVSIGVNAEVPDDSGGSDAGTDGGSDGSGTSGDGGSDSSDADTSIDTDTAGGDDDGGDDGCGCRSHPRGGAGWLALTVGLLLVRRRRA